LIGITLTFISLTAPIQLHGHNITLFWASEAVLLYWLFQKSRISIIQYASVIIWFAMIISLLIDWVNIYADTTTALTVIVNKGFITGVYSAVASYVLFFLRNKTLSGENNSLGKSISKNVFRISALVLLFLTGVLEVDHQFRHNFPHYAMNILYLQLYSFAFVLLLLFINSKIQTIKIPIRAQVILLIICITFYMVSLRTISSLQDQLLQAQQFTGYFNACWIIAFLAGIIFYKLIQIERTGHP